MGDHGHGQGGHLSPSPPRNVVKCILYISSYSKRLGRRIIYALLHNLLSYFGGFTRRPHWSSNPEPHLDFLPWPLICPPLEPAGIYIISGAHTGQCRQCSTVAELCWPLWKSLQTVSVTKCILILLLLSAKCCYCVAKCDSSWSCRVWNVKSSVSQSWKVTACAKMTW